MSDDDPYRMFLVLRRGAVESLARAGELAGAAAVGCVLNPEWAEPEAAWRARPGKVCLRARSPAQWAAVLALPHALAGDAIAALPPRRRSERGPVLERLQAMSTELEPAPAAPALRPVYDPYRMFLVLHKGTITSLAEAGVLAGSAAVACVREFAEDERFAEAFTAWRERPGKVCLRARSPSQWAAVLEEPHASAVIEGDAGRREVIAIPPRRRSERGRTLERLQAMSTELEPPPISSRVGPGRVPEHVTYVLNPSVAMSSGKTIAQIAHAAVMAAERLSAWTEDGLSASVMAPDAEGFAAACAHRRCVAKVVDAGLTEVPPGTITVVAVQG